MAVVGSVKSNECVYTYKEGVNSCEVISSMPILQFPYTILHCAAG